MVDALVGFQVGGGMATLAARKEGGRAAPGRMFGNIVGPLALALKLMTEFA
jgi:hypothetical protein